MRIRAFIQARLSSCRFPGKVLAPFCGEPLILHVVRALERILDSDALIVATSGEASDDPLAAYAERMGVGLFRGPLEDVFERFRKCALMFPSEWILRVSADSPLLDSEVLKKVIESADDAEWDLVTTTFPRTFPKGQNAELIRVSTFLNLDPVQLSAHDREHVTAYYYRNPNQFRIRNVESEDPRLAELNVAVDTVDDLRRLEEMCGRESPRLGLAV